MRTTTESSISIFSVSSSRSFSVKSAKTQRWVGIARHSHPPDPKMKGINSFLLVESFNLAVYIILLHSMTYGEQTLCQRGFALIRTIFSISNEIPIDLNRISQQFSQHQRTLLFYTGERRIPFHSFVMRRPHRSSLVSDGNAADCDVPDLRDRVGKQPSRLFRQEREDLAGADSANVRICRL